MTQPVYEYIKDAMQQKPINFSLHLDNMGVLVIKYDGFFQHKKIVSWTEIETCRINPIVKAMDSMK